MTICDKGFITLFARFYYKTLNKEVELGELYGTTVLYTFPIVHKSIVFNQSSSHNNPLPLLVLEF